MRIAATIARSGTCHVLALGLVFALFAPGLTGPLMGKLNLKSGSEAQAQQNASVNIIGNRRIETATILSYMQLPQDRPATPEDLNGAVRRLFDTGLFRDVQIVPGQGTLTVEVIENPSISVIAFEGNSALTDEDLEQIIQTRPRLPFTRSGAEADAQRIIEVYRRIGRYGAEVEPVIIERTENRVDLVFEISEGEITEVSSIDFVGNERFSDRRLRRVIETSESGLLSALISTDVYDPDRLELDKELLRQFYLSRGFADFAVLSATAELSPDREGFFITFTVSEGEEYSFGTFDVLITARGLDAEEFRTLLPDNLEGDTYDASRVEEIANEMTDLAGQRGFAFVQVQPRADKNAEDRVISVNFELIEGSRVFVERVDVIGNTRTLDRVIRREVELVEGDAFDARKVRRSRNNIRGLGYFKQVDVETDQGSADDRAVITVKVQEQSTGSLSLGVGFSSSAGPIGNIALTERNFLGRGQVVNLELTATGDTQNYDFTFTEPKFLDRDLSIGTRAFYTKDDRSDTSSFSVDSGGFSPQLGFPLSADLRIKPRYELLYEDVNVSNGASPAIQVDDGSQFTSSVGFELTYDKRNDPVEPTRGYLAVFDQQLAGLGGSSYFTKSRGRFATWRGFLDDVVIAKLELESGVIHSFDGDTRITERYFLGGQTFRGFADEGLGPRDRPFDDALGGNYFGIARLEVSFPIGLPEELGIYGGAFMDAGTVWGLDSTNFVGSNIDEDASLRVSAGGLLFVETPLGPLELSLGFPLVKKSYDETELFRLSLGTRF